MALQFIIGGSGAGKSYAAMKQLIKQSVEQPQGHYILLVPEQFTMQTQKDIVAMHPHHGTLNIDILSFERLAYRVFEELGTDVLEILDDTGKNLILRRVLKQVQPQLSIFAGKVNYQGFLEEIKSVLSEFGQYGIDQAQLALMEDRTSTRPLLHAKLQDIHTIYNCFVETIASHYVTSEAVLSVLARQVSQSRIVKNSVIYIDGFTGFTPIQYQLLEQLLVYAKDMALTVIMTKSAYEQMPQEGELFAMGRGVLERMTALAGNNQIPVKAYAWIAHKENRFRDSAELGLLEQNLFSFDREKQAAPKQQVFAYGAANPKEEADYVAAKIYELVQTGYRYRDIAVITADLEGYYRIVKDSFQAQNVPSFIDYKKNITGNPCVELILSAFTVAEQDFSYEAVFRYLKTGFTNVPKEDIDLLENYVLAMNIRGNRRYQKQWEKPSKTMKEDCLPAVNRARELVMEGLLPFSEVVRKKNVSVRKKIQAVYKLLTDLEVEKQLTEYAEIFLQTGQMERNREYVQIWKTIVDLLDKVVRLFGDTYASAQELREILESGFAEIKVAVIPPGLDEVTVGDMTRTRLKDVKVLFFIGVNDGMIPPPAVPGGVLSNMDRIYLKEQSFELAPTVREQAAIDRLYLYLALTKASNTLYLTYSTASMDGKEIRPSSLLFQIEQALGRRLSLEQWDANQTFHNIRKMKAYVAEEIGAYGTKVLSPRWQEAFTYLKGHEEYQQYINAMIAGACYEGGQNALNQAVAGKLFPEKQLRSITRLEQFASCAYCHFMQYGLALVPREIHQVEATDIGTLFHNALEYISREMEQGTYGWRTLTDEERKQLVNAAVEQTLEEFDNTAIDSSARNQYMKNRLLRVTDRTVWALSQQIKQGEFEPAYYEFQTEKGRVDRIDLYETNDAVYVKIIDYKSGLKQFRLLDAYYGLQMQLVWYLADTIEALKKQYPGKEVRPGAIFYYHIQDPYVDLDAQDYLKQFAMSGLVNSRVEVIESLDTQLAQKRTSSVIPVSYTKANAPDSRSKIATEEQFADLEAYVKNEAQQMHAQIRGGMIAKNPYKRSNQSPCDYCDYKNVCGFDTRLPGFTYRQLPNMKQEVLWENFKKGAFENGMDEKPEEGN